MNTYWVQSLKNIQGTTLDLAASSGVLSDSGRLKLSDPGCKPTWGVWWSTFSVQGARACWRNKQCTFPALPIAADLPQPIAAFHRCRGHRPLPSSPWRISWKVRISQRGKGRKCGLVRGGLFYKGLEGSSGHPIEQALHAMKCFDLRQCCAFLREWGVHKV